MSDLNTLLNKLEVIETVVKEVIINNVLITYHQSYIRENQSTESRELIILLRNSDRSVQDKINDIQTYLENEHNHGRRLFNCFVAEIEDVWHKEFFPSEQLNYEFISWAQSKNLHLLNARGRQSIVSDIVKDIDAQKDHIKNPASHSLIISLKQDTDFEIKWQSLLAYARVSANANQVVYNSIVKTINSKLAGVNAGSDIYLMAQINNHEFYNELVDEKSKSIIISEVLSQYLTNPSMMPSEASKELCIKLQSDAYPLKTKWDYLISYFANGNNVYRNLYRIIRNVIDVKLQEQYIQLIKDLNVQNDLVKSHMQQEQYQQASQLLEDYLLKYRTVRYPDNYVLVDKYSLLADCYSKCGHNDKAISAYQNIFMLRNNELSKVKKVEILLKLFSCYLSVKDYKNAFIIGQSINQIWQNSSAKDRKALKILITQQNQLRNQLIKEDGYLKYVKSFTAMNSSDYRSLFFRESAVKGTAIGAATGAAIVYVGTQLDIIGLLLVPAGVVVLAAGAVPGVFFGSIHGLFRATSRKPLNKAEQLAFIDNLNKFAAVDDQQKDLFISKVVNQYRETKTLSASDSSEKLLLALTDSKLTTAEKSHEIIAYILATNEGSVFHPKETVIYKNNGKRLFCIIHELLKEQLAEFEKHSSSVKM